MREGNRRRRRDSMPVLEGLAETAGKDHGDVLKDIVVLHINHCMDNSFYFTEILNRLFYRAVFVGVPYNDMAVETGWSFVSCYGRKRQDFYELWREETCFGRCEGDFMEAVERLIYEALLKDIKPCMEEGKQLLIIEDGGYHYPVLNRFMEENPRFAGQVRGSVEQTASGTLRCREFGERKGYAYPCASISRSDIKMHIESRFIGHRVVEELASFLYTANAFLDFHNVLLLGYGIVGRQVAKDLEGRNCCIHVLDTDLRVAKVAGDDGFSVVEEINPRLFGSDTMVIGNTGEAAFTGEMLAMFFMSVSSKLYLASSSSQDQEFKVFLNMATAKVPWPEGAALSGREDFEYYSRFLFDYRGMQKEIILIAQGLPVNFYRKNGISLTYSVIDLIFAQMLSEGLGFCVKDGWEKGLRLLGMEEGFGGYWSEEELAKSWFLNYGLAGSGGDWDFPKSHPEADYLRQRMAGERG